jgi:outer membrane protein OmpA-like peptidoglycan-associated protein
MRLENVLFESGTANMLPESEPTLNELGRALERYPDVRIEVEGHTDTRGPADNNQRLSQARAETVRNYLVRNFNVKPENVVARGYGETRPETRERNEEELLRNRRVEIQVLNPEVLPSEVRPR